MLHKTESKFGCEGEEVNGSCNGAIPKQASTRFPAGVIGNYAWNLQFSA